MVARHGLVLLAVVFAIALSIGPAAVDAAPGKYFENNRLGCRVRAPQDWTQIPPKTGEQYMALKFLSDKKYSVLDKATGFTSEHQPEMIVLAFIHQVTEDSGVKVEKDGDTLLVQFKSPYKDYKDFLDRTYREGGYFFAKEEKGKVNGLEVDKYEVKVEKLVNGGPRRIITWVYHTEDVDFAVQFEVLEDEYKGLRNEVYGCLKSFSSIPRSEGSLVEGTATGGGTLMIGEDELSPKERRARRVANERRLHEKAEEGLPDGWTVKKIKRFLVINHTDLKYAKKVVAHAEAVWNWLDDTLDFVGPDEYVRQPILRICENAEEERSFMRGSGDWGGMGIEIVTHQDKSSGSMSWEFEYVNKRTLAIWFQERDRDLYWALPYWVDYGLYQVLGTARSKGRKLEFHADDWEKDLRTARRDGTLASPQELLKMTRSDITGQKLKESGALVRFLLTGPAARSKRTRTILTDYLKNLKTILEEQKAELDKEVADEKEPETEAEEEEYFRRRRQALKEKEGKLLEEVFERTFKDWTDRDWAQFKKLYEDSLG